MERTDVDGTTARLAAFASGLRYEDIPGEVVHEATRRIVDSLGCAFGGFDAEPGRIAREIAGEHRGDRGARVLGLAPPATAERAAFANAVMVRYQDLNDVNKALRGGGHPSDAIPAVLAVADAYHASGKAALVGVIAAYQGFGAMPVHFKKRGWDQGIMVAIAVAMGAGSVLGLGEEQLANAISLALTPSLPLCVTRRGQLSMWKSCASAATDQSAVFATLLAAKGMTGPTKPFEGTHGLWDQATGPFVLELDPARYGYRIAQSDIKRFPSCGSTQAVLSTLLEMAEGLRPEDVESIEVRTHWDTWFETGKEPEKWDPRSRETADHSLPFVMATALRDGNVTLASFTHEAIRDVGLRSIMDRIRVSEDPALTALRPAQTLSDIEITLRSGARRAARTGIQRGDHRNPMSDAELEQKFRGMAEPLATRERCDRVLDELWGLARAADVSTVMDTWASSIEPKP